MRPARTCFVYLDWKTQNESRKGAYHLAKQGLKTTAEKTPFKFYSGAEGQAPATVERPVSSARKVTTDLPEISPPRPKRWKGGEDESIEYLDETHRGRAKVHALQAGLRKQLVECANNKEFWDFVRKRTDPRPKKSKVTVDQLTAFPGSQGRGCLARPCSVEVPKQAEP
ncbi:hypothetical protein C8R46DRAFT_1294879 [Mycena filopes]|nr:hypothetical protein C8R46DRAFT_1294879 [Mycena filopes]